MVDESELFVDGGKIPCILVENKIDLLDDSNEGEESLNQLAKDADFCGCFRTSAKIGKNVTESVEFLIRTIIKRLKDMQNKDFVNEPLRETIKLDRQTVLSSASKTRKCC